MSDNPKLTSVSLSPDEEGQPATEALVYDNPRAEQAAGIISVQAKRGMALRHYITFDNREVLMVFEKKEGK